MKENILVTGGAGFIGSNLSKVLIQHRNVEKIFIIDNLSTGNLSNISDILQNPKLEFIEGDIRNMKILSKIIKHVDRISHQAALGSVPRSIEDPITSAEVNIIGTLNLLKSAHEEKIKNTVLAFSSSAYGNKNLNPKKESQIPSPESPYAVTKVSSEQFSEVFGNIFKLNWIGLRYFNIFGNHQDPFNPYAAVIPKFVESFINRTPVTINGSDEISRDFTHVSNAVTANLLALYSTNGLNRIYNIGSGRSISLKKVISTLSNIFGYAPAIEYRPFREGDVMESCADISMANKHLKYFPVDNFEKQLEDYVSWLSNK